jgi:hypothetical protein
MQNAIAPMLGTKDAALTPIDARRSPLRVWGDADRVGVTLSLHAIRKPVPDALERYRAPSANRKPTRLFETRSARPTSRGARDTGAPAGKE